MAEVSDEHSLSTGSNVRATQESKNASKIVASSHDQHTTADANAPNASASVAAPAANSKPLPKNIEAFERSEGEKRFRTNCGRCHQAPHKFPPRIMATVIRHMRVRAMITDEDLRLILRYMTQ